jgi:hypothetical protein
LSKLKEMETVADMASLYGLGNRGEKKAL